MPIEINQLLDHVANQVDSRFFGKFRGKVTDNSDPLDLGRVKATVPALLDTEETGWALPAFPYGGISEQGFFFVPDVGANVWIEFEAGNLSYPIWTGVFFSSGDVPESAKPEQKVIKTKSGHKVILDDDAGTLEITDSNSNTIRMDSSLISIKAGDATKIVVDAPQIELVDGASHALVFGDNLLQYLNQLVQTFSTHTHPGQMAGPVPVSPMLPTPPATPPQPSLLSQKVKTG
jgi:phage baseplate assembly protein gpV